MNKPCYEEMRKISQDRFTNGFGPYWLPKAVRRALTSFLGRFFCVEHANKHDFDYAAGCKPDDRLRYDQSFLFRLKIDASNHPPPKRYIAFVLAYTCYAAVRLGGRFSFNFAGEYKTLDEVLNV